MKTRIEIYNSSLDEKLSPFVQIEGISGCLNIKFYKLESEVEVSTDLIEEVFVDSVCEQLFCDEYGLINDYDLVIEKSFKPGVTDNASRSAQDAFSLLKHNVRINSGNLYLIKGKLDTKFLSLFGNELIEDIKVHPVADFFKLNRFNDINFNDVILESSNEVEVVNLDLSDSALERLSIDRCLALTVDELKVIRDHYQAQSDERLKLGMPVMPTDVELEVIAQTWSEHCKHKIFAAQIDYIEDGDFSGPKIGDQTINGLYKSFVKSSTKKVEKDFSKDWLVSVFEDNAGIVRFDKHVDLCIKVETHNSPSALDPYGGALTGILGVNRDILGCGYGALPIANTDVFCFADPKLPQIGDESQLPYNLLNPSQILSGVHKGVEDGGNKSGIPTVNGAMYFDDSFAGKPLVFVGTVGVMPKQDRVKKAQNGDAIVVIGGEVGADGIHGATFSSLELDENSPVTAVQIGDPLTQKRVMDFLMLARDKDLYTSITDNGAGGISSSIGEMALQSGGAQIDLSLCPLKYQGLKPYEIMISESQERMSLAVSKNKLEEFLRLAQKMGVGAHHIGHFSADGKLTVTHAQELVGVLDLHFLHDGLPQMKLKAKWQAPLKRSQWFQRSESKKPISKVSLFEMIDTLLRSPNIASKEKYVRQYDHEVKGATHIKPFNGKTQSAPSDLGGIWLKPYGGEDNNAVAVSCGLNPRLSSMDPYFMAQFAVDEAVRNLISGGVNPDQICLLDNFCWPDPIKSEKNPDGDIKLGALVRANKGLYDIVTTYGAPLVSGKDSMKNDYRGKNRRGEPLSISVLPTLLVTAMGQYDVTKTVDSSFKGQDDHIFVLGNAQSGLAHSELGEYFELGNATNPGIDMEANYKLYRRLYTAIGSDLLSSCHDISDGGALIAMIESSFGNEIGFDVSSKFFEGEVISNFFNESAGRFIVSVAPKNLERFHKHFKAEEVFYAGKTNASKMIRFTTNDLNLNLDVNELQNTWKGVF